MDTEKAVVVTDDNCQAVATTPATLLSMAVQQGADLDKLEKLMELQERWEANEAKKAYVAAMAAFKKDPPKINKDQNVSFSAGGGTTSYNHSSLANVTEKINSGLSVHGLSANWTTDQTDQIKVTCTITHEMGHSESTSLKAGPDDSGKKNKIQQIGSTISYLERYTILALTGLATHEDDDGKGSDPVEYISLDQQTDILDQIKSTGADIKGFLKYLKAESVDTIPAGKYKLALQALEAKRKKNEGAV